MLCVAVMGTSVLTYAVMPEEWKILLGDSVDGRLHGAVLQHPRAEAADS